MDLAKRSSNQGQGYSLLSPRISRLVLGTTCMSQAVKKSEERPTLRSVANAIRTGIFIEKIYRRMSKSQMMSVPKEVENCLEVSYFLKRSAELIILHSSTACQRLEL